MKLFDENLADGLNKYKGVRLVDFEVLEKLVSIDEVRLSRYRDFLEDAFSKLDENSQNRIKRELVKDPNKFKKTFNELIVGSYLVNLGYKVEYDKNINGQTPDWWVQNSEGDDQFFLDVRTQEVRFSKQEVSSSIDEEFRKTSSGRKQFDEAIEKVGKYSEIIENENIPFLLALVSDWVVNIEMQELVTSYYSFILTVDGKNYGFVGKAGEDELVEKPYIKFGYDVFIELEEDDEKGIFKEENLSGILDVKVNPYNAYEIGLIINPEAKFKISNDMFPNTKLVDAYEIFHIN